MKPFLPLNNGNPQFIAKMEVRSKFLEPIIAMSSAMNSLTLIVRTKGLGDIGNLQVHHKKWPS